MRQISSSGFVTEPGLDLSPAMISTKARPGSAICIEAWAKELGMRDTASS
jgi:hypothetical protein